MCLKFSIRIEIKFSNDKSLVNTIIRRLYSWILQKHAMLFGICRQYNVTTLHGRVEMHFRVLHAFRNILRDDRKVWVKRTSGIPYITFLQIDSSHSGHRKARQDYVFASSIWNVQLHNLEMSSVQYARRLHTVFMTVSLSLSLFLWNETAHPWGILFI